MCAEVHHVTGNSILNHMMFCDSWVQVLNEMVIKGPRRNSAQQLIKQPLWNDFLCQQDTSVRLSGFTPLQPFTWLKGWIFY